MNTFDHRPDCSAYGDPRWLDIVECGECEVRWMKEWGLLSDPHDKVKP